MFSFGLALSQAKRHFKIIERLFLCIMWAIFLLVSYSCAPTETVAPVLEANLFRSEDYIVYMLQNNETPAELAKTFLGERSKSWVIEEANPGIRFDNGNAIVIPLKDRNKGGLSSTGIQSIPILTYHRFAENCSSPLCMPKNTFELQMRYLKENG